MLFATQTIAEQCRTFIQQRSATLGAPVTARLVHLFICPEDKQNNSVVTKDDQSIASSCADLHIVLFPSDAFPIAKQFWQHAGLGISSRLAEKCLSLLPVDTPNVQRPISPILGRIPGKEQNRHYSAVKSRPTSPPAVQLSPTSPLSAVEDSNPDSVYLEERYGRNLPLHAASLAKRVLRSRVAGTLIKGNIYDCVNDSGSEKNELVVGPSVRGIADVAAEDVYLYPSGMAAIWSAHNIALSVLPPAKSVCFGFVHRSLYPFLHQLNDVNVDLHTPIPSKSSRSGALDAIFWASASILILMNWRKYSKPSPNATPQSLQSLPSSRSFLRTRSSDLPTSLAFVLWQTNTTS